MVSTLSPIRRRDDGAVVMLDQRALPFETLEVVLETAESVATAIADMVIRGAPAIGVAAAMGLALGLGRMVADGSFTPTVFAAQCDMMARSRPTAVNLFWAIARIRKTFEQHISAGADANAIVALIDAEANAIFAEDLAQNHAIGDFGAALIPDGARILTHCNTGSLATAGWGTALGVIRSAVAAGKRIHVFADETRPWLQGARLTAWELMADGIDVTLIADGAAGHLMQRGEIDLAIVGADRITANGDTANKIGTYTVACLAARHGLPFYVAAPLTTIDRGLQTGACIAIEERPGDEVRTVFGRPVAPENVPVRNPSFDVTPAELISALITERGIARPPFGPSIAALFESQQPAASRPGFPGR